LALVSTAATPPAQITVVMSQPRIPASGGTLAGLQAQNGATSASGVPYANGECGAGPGRRAHLGLGSGSAATQESERVTCGARSGQ
jgi:hypothetical protein